jgi:hypothetical protein
MTDAQRPPDPGERRLDRPPSDRYARPEPEIGTSPAPVGSHWRALSVSAGVGAVGALATILLGGVLGLSAGLLVVAGATGWGIGAAWVAAGRDAVQASRRLWLTAAVAIGSFVAGQLGLWLNARAEGGVLTLPDYLGQTFGLLVPLQAVLVIGVAWWTARSTTRP